MKVDLDTGFVFVDVKKGRSALLKRINKGERPTVWVKCRLLDASSHDDGVSIEFTGEVIKAEISQ